MSLLGGRSAWRYKEGLVRAPAISNHALQSTLRVLCRQLYTYFLRAFNLRELAVYMMSGSASNITARYPELFFLCCLCHRPWPTRPSSWLFITNSLLESCGVRPERIDPPINMNAIARTICGAGTLTRRLVRHEFSHAVWEPWPLV